MTAIAYFSAKEKQLRVNGLGGCANAMMKIVEDLKAILNGDRTPFVRKARIIEQPNKTQQNIAIALIKISPENALISAIAFFDEIAETQIKNGGDDDQIESVKAIRDGLKTFLSTDQKRYIERTIQ